MPYSEIFSFVKARSESDEGFASSLLQRYRRLARYARLGAPFMAFVSRPNKSAKYTFIGRRLSDVILGLPRDEVQVIGNQLDYLFCKKHGLSYVSNCEAWPVVTKALPSLGQGVSDSEVEKSLRRFPGQNTGVLIVSNDSLPVERLMLLAAKGAGMKTICVQDGLMLATAPQHCAHGRFADYMFVFSQQQLDVIAAHGVPRQKMQIMGFHSDIPMVEKLEPLRAGKNRRVCFLGQPVPLFYPTKGEWYLGLVNEVLSRLEFAGFKVDYKPHPGEKGGDHLKSFNNIFKGSLHKALDNYDVFLSLNSTALLEATLSERIALQIRDELFMDDNFKVCGFAHSMRSTSLDLLPQLVNKLEPLNDVETKEMVSGTAASRFLKTISKTFADE